MNMSTNTHKSAWQDVYAAMFGKRLTVGERAAFEEIIGEKIPSPFHGEIAKAIKSLGAGDVPRSSDYAPTGEAILAEMRKLRREYVLAKNGDGCAHCDGRGWMSYRFLHDENGKITLGGKRGNVFHPNENSGGVAESCPCRCSKGQVFSQAAITKGRARQDDVEELQREVMIARSEFNRMNAA